MGTNPAQRVITSKNGFAQRRGSNIANNDGNNVLHLALKQKKADLNMIKQLFASGADPKTVDSDGNTALHLALKKNSIDIKLIKTIVLMVLINKLKIRRSKPR
jgi:ankyrin repeat protein